MIDKDIQNFGIRIFLTSLENRFLPFIIWIVVSWIIRTNPNWTTAIIFTIAFRDSGFSDFFWTWITACFWTFKCYLQEINWGWPIRLSSLGWNYYLWWWFVWTCWVTTNISIDTNTSISAIICIWLEFVTTFILKFIFYIKHMMYHMAFILNLLENNVIPSMRKINQVNRLGSTLTPDNTVSINHGKFKSKLKS